MGVDKVRMITELFLVLQVFWGSLTWIHLFLSFDFCEVPEEWADKDPPENLGQVVFGERLRTSPYKITYQQNSTNTKLCSRKYDLSKRADRRKLHFIRERIIEGYMHAWVIDNMPVTWCYHLTSSEKQFCTTRFPVGCHVSKDGTRQEACFVSVSLCHQFVFIISSSYFFFLLPFLSLLLLQPKMSRAGSTYIFNHVQFLIWYHSGSTRIHNDGHVVKTSVALASCDSPHCSSTSDPVKLKKKGELHIDYSYSVVFMVSISFPYVNLTHTNVIRLIAENSFNKYPSPSCSN